MAPIRKFAPGDTVTPFVREGTFQHWNRYAGVNYEFADHHMDDDVGRHEGFGAAFGMGPLIHAYVHTMLRQWIDADLGRVTGVSIQLRSPFLRGRTLTATGSVKAVRAEGGEQHVDLDVWADNDKGERLAIGTAQVVAPL